MFEQEVIKISDGDSDDEVQVTGVREVRRPRNSQRQRRIDLVAVDDDVQIVRVNENPNRNSSPGVVLHTPGGELLVPDDRNLFSDLPTPLGLVSEEERERQGLETRFRSYEEIERERVMRERDPLHRLHSTMNQRTRQRERELQHRNQIHDRRNFRDPFNLPPGLTTLWRMRGFLTDEGERDGEEEGEDYDPDYYPGMNIPNAFFQHHGHRAPPFLAFGTGAESGGLRGQNDDLPANIMQLIEQRENVEFDKKQKANLNATDNIQRELKSKAEKIRNPYSIKIDSEEDYVCILCGVTLGEGIPANYEIHRSRQPLAKLQEENDVQAPYQAVNLLTDADKDLSKRIFISKCGHAYCGRCVKNISGIKEILKGNNKKFKKTDNDISNPFLYAPLSCVGLDCKVKVNGKTTFNEIFL